MDYRIINFSKWILPKTESALTGNMELSIGHFDSIKVTKLECKNDQPLAMYAENKHKIETEATTNSSTYQQIFMFTNTAEQENMEKGIYCNKKVDDFWLDTNPCLVRYYSLLHINYGNDKNSIIALIKKINNKLNDSSNEYKSLCYFSLDYSDIIICSKKISLQAFTQFIFELNYNYGDVKMIRDSFSILSINNNILKELKNYISHISNFDNAIEKQKCQSIIKKFLLKNNINLEEIEQNSFNCSFNIGIQNYNTYLKLIKDLDKINLEYEEYRMLGRHDATLFNKKADIYWLIIMELIIDAYSSIDNSLNLNENDVIFNAETYIRIPYLNNKEVIIDSESDNKLYDYKKIEKRLNTLITDYKSEKNLKTEHLTPIIALKNSILGLLKNGFADDFVLCIYDSFVSFLIYITRKVKNKNESGVYIDYDKKNEFDLCFNTYFDNINALINSAMHSERQFVQSPSFNPVFFDVPPKLLAYYNAILRKIYHILHEENDCNYSFMFRPSFTREISVTTYSFQEDTVPTDRLLYVTMNEKELYYPSKIISQFTHEVAHYVGNKNRYRNKRIESILKSILFDIITEFSESFFNKTIEPNKKIVLINEILKKINQESFFSFEIAAYSDYSFNYIFFAIRFIKNNSDILASILNLYKSQLNIDNTTINLAKKSLEDFFERKLNLLNTENYDISEKLNKLINIYSEIYSDLQMIYILNLSLNDYLNQFDPFILNEEFQDARKYSEVYFRLFNIIMFFLFKNKWKFNEKVNDNYLNILNLIYIDILDYLSCFSVNFKEEYESSFSVDKVLKNMKDITSDWDCTHYWNANIQKYLISSYNICINHYRSENKMDNIKELADSVRKINKFEDAIEIFTHIQTTNNDYETKILQ